jgi:hypothetical protein
VESKDDTTSASSVVGSLPESVQPNDLPRLNEALAYLFQELHKAALLYQSNPDAGREGVIHSLETVLKFLSVFAPVISSGLHAPLAVLFDALMNLGEGSVLPLLRPPRKFGRLRASAMRGSLIGAVAFTVKRLTETGMNAPAAHIAVARCLKGADVKPARGRAGAIITKRTIRGWCEQVSADVGRHGEAAQTYDLLTTDPTAGVTTKLPPKKARTILLRRLVEAAKKIRAQEDS